MIVYAQDSGDVPRIIDRVREIAEASEEGYDMPVTVDKDAYWGMLWYIRDFNNAEYADLDNLTEPPKGEVVLISNNNRTKMAAYQSSYAPRRGLHLPVVACRRVQAVRRGGHGAVLPTHRPVQQRDQQGEVAGGPGLLHLPQDRPGVPDARRGRLLPQGGYGGVAAAEVMAACGGLPLAAILEPTSPSR